ncbi:LysR family transcriptional regulator [Microbulbifer sp. S227A]|uniref:LysR family transcriptional regulator n=1 Tax=Microbulbifer sp. S227A TaxID=3415131 RepID=UPI003C7BBE2A
MELTLKHARYFVAAAQAGQVSRAAVELNVSQSAVTTAIRDLEANLGVQLFERRPRGVALTEAGTRFLRHAKELLAVAHEAMNLSADDQTRLRGRVRIGMSYTVAGYFAIPVLARVKRRFAGLDLSLCEDRRDVIEQELVQGRLDLAIILTSNLGERALLDHVTLVQSKRRLWLPSGHRLAGRDDLPLSVIEDEPYILLTVDEAKNTQIRYWQDRQVSPRIAFETSSVEAVRTMVASGMGITVLSDMVYRPWSLDGQRIETSDITEGVVPQMMIGVCWNAQAPLGPAPRAIVDFLMQIFGIDHQTPPDPRPSHHPQV